MKTISLATTQKNTSVPRQEHIDFLAITKNQKRTFSVLSFIQKSNKVLFLLLMMVIALLPASLTNATFYTEATVTGSEFSTGCWIQPTVPVLVSLPDNALIHQGNPWLSNSVMTWNASDTTCPTGHLQYQFRVATDAGFTNIVQTSDWLDNTQFITSANSNGQYYWDVTVRDSAHVNILPITTPSHHYTIDLSDLQAPNNLGWNLLTQSATPNEMPLDLTCGATTNGGDPNNPTVAHNWSAVSGNNIKYQREVTYPDGSTVGFFYETNNFTQFSSFGSPPGIEGLWKSRVKAFEDDNNNGLIDPGERTSVFSNYCNLTLDLNPPVQSPIVLNELLPDPQGPDNFALPFGEWVELYNRTDSPVDINGWKITADPANQFPMIVSVTNTFAGLPFGVGTTVLPAHGFLVVYRSGNPNFDLKNIPEGVTDSETVRLFNASDALQDEHTYATTRENKSITRSPDGADNWVDPIPSPGRPNVVDASQLDPSTMIAEQDEHHAVVALLEAGNYESADMTIEYDRKQDGSNVKEAMTKQISVTNNVQFISDLFLGSVSSGVEYPHAHISNVKVHITLYSDHLPDKIIEAEMSGNWRPE